MTEPRTAELSRLAKQLLIKSLWITLGRRNLVRLGRFLSNEARFDVANVMATNGEALLQHSVLSNNVGALTAIDVGANVGDWSSSLLRQVPRSQRGALSLYCFEPAPAAFEILQQRLAEHAGPKLAILPFAVSETDGEATLHMVSEAAGINSLHPRHDHETKGSIRVPMRSLDSFAREHELGRIALVKCDAEGHDFAVLQGARELLKAQRIDIFQFEYNWRWVDARHFLRDVFDLAREVGYAVGKLTPKGVERYGAWDPELESFREGNYVLIAPAAIGWVELVTWWKDQG